MKLPGQVAPRRGAWIETVHKPQVSLIKRVAPRRGAWIETEIEVNEYLNELRRTPQGCVD